MFGNRPPSVSASSEQSASPKAALRRYARVGADLAVEYDVEGFLERRMGRIDDIGGGGVRLQTIEDLAAATKIAMIFMVAGTEISADGRVVLSYFDGKVKRFLHGVAFTAIDPTHQAAIARYVEQMRSA